MSEQTSIENQQTLMDAESRVAQLTRHFIKIKHKESVQQARFLASLGKLTIQQLSVLNFIGDHQPCTMSDIANHAHLALSTVTSIVNKLVKVQYVERFRSDIDRRIVLAKLTNEGHLVFRNQIELIRQGAREVLSVLNDQEQLVFLDFSKRFAEH